MLFEAIQKRLRYRKANVALGRLRLDALVADSFLKRMIGLMFRNELSGRECMLFIFGRPGRYGIWMKNMRFSIDVVWIDDKFNVVDYAQNLKPCSKIICRTYYPETESKYIIEAEAGFVKSNNLRKRMKIKID